MVSAVSARIVAGPRDTAATVNNDVRLRCAAVGDPPPSVTWLKNGDPVIPSDYFRIVDGGSLRILGVVASDAGMYQCIAANSAGSTQATAELLVHVNGTQSRLIVTHTHTRPFNGPLSRTNRVSRYQKGKTNLDFTEARDSEWQ